jgi:hypothetical protein
MSTKTVLGAGLAVVVAGVLMYYMACNRTRAVERCATPSCQITVTLGSGPGSCNVSPRNPGFSSSDDVQWVYAAGQSGHQMVHFPVNGPFHPNVFPVGSPPQHPDKCNRPGGCPWPYFIDNCGVSYYIGVHISH